MSANLQLYSLLFFSGDGSLFAEEQEVDLRRTIGASRVFTVMKGFAGLSPGSPLIEISVRNAVPQGGFEFDMGKKMLGLITLDAQVWGPGGTNLKGKAFVETDSLRHSVNQEAIYSFTCVMPLQLFN